MMQLVSLTTPPPCCVGWLPDQKLSGPQKSSKMGVWSLGKVSRHMSSWTDTNCADLIRQRCPLPCQRYRRAWQPLWGREYGSGCPWHKRNGMSCCGWECRRIGREQFQAFTRECLVERTKPIYNAIYRNKLKLREVWVKGSSRWPVLAAVHRLLDGRWKPSRVLSSWESGVSYGTFWWMKPPLRHGEWSPHMKSDLLTCPVRGSCHHQYSSWWSSHHPDAEASCSQKLWWVCPRDLHPVPVHKASNCVTPGPSVGQLHCRFTEMQCKSKAWKRSVQTSGGCSSHTGNWQNFLQMDSNKTAVPISNSPQVIWPGGQAAFHHWWSPQQVTTAGSGLARPMQLWRSRQSHVAACIPCSPAWSPQDNDPDCWH